MAVHRRVVGGLQQDEESGRKKKQCFGLQEKRLLVLLVFGCRLSQTVLRMSIGALVIYICEDYGCGDSSKGWLLSAHAFGYCTTQILGGQLADRCGGRSVVGASLGLAGFALACTPALGHAFGLYGIASAQVVMGIATGPLFPASMELLSKSLPSSERAVASTVLDTGITAGSLIVVPLSGSLVVRFSWQMTFMIYGLMAIGYALIWHCYTTEPEPSPETQVSANDQEKVTSAPTATARASAMDAAVAVCHRRLWAIYWAHFTFNYGIYFVNSWSAIYYLEVFKLRPEDASLYLSLPHAVNMLVKVCLNRPFERFLRAQHFTDLGCRCIFSGVGFVLCAICFELIPSLTSALSATACFSVVLGFMALHPSGFKANYMDVTTSHGGIISGFGNTMASVASSLGPLAVAHMRGSTGGWDRAFQSVAAVNILAALVFCTFASTTPIEVAGPGERRWRLMPRVEGRDR
mmetsp:Transcript_109574/g.244658  ORF Transcript_109574/g.244658 Transcript_109574/m.244658 type:complete len:464 (+) Transcript_109574:71-1462(+)